MKKIGIIICGRFGAVARKLTYVIFAILRDNKLYSPVIPPNLPLDIS